MGQAEVHEKEYRFVNRFDIERAFGVNHTSAEDNTLKLIVNAHNGVEQRLSLVRSLREKDLTFDLSEGRGPLGTFIKD